jgi:hypothetical protein
VDSQPFPRSNCGSICQFGFETALPVDMLPQSRVPMVLSPSFSWADLDQDNLGRIFGCLSPETRYGISKASLTHIVRSRLSQSPVCRLDFRNLARSVFKSALEERGDSVAQLAHT